MIKALKKEPMKMFVLVLLVINLLLSIYISFFRSSAYGLETLKAWGRENMKMAKQLYTSEAYIQQQKSTLEQYLSSIQQAPVLDVQE